MSGKIDCITSNSPMVDVNVRKHFDLATESLFLLFEWM